MSTAKREIERALEPHCVVCDAENPTVKLECDSCGDEIHLCAQHNDRRKLCDNCADALTKGN